MVYGSLPLLSPFGGGEGEDGKRGYRRQKTEGRRQFQIVASNVQNIHPRSCGPPPPAVDSRDALSRGFVKVLFTPGHPPPAC